MGNSIYHSEAIYNCLREMNLCRKFRQIVIKHMMAIIASMFMQGYRGKTVDFARCSEHHRTTLAYFLNHGKWDDKALEAILKSEVIRIIYGIASRTGKPVYCIVDDTIASKTKPSSRALHPIEAAYFHQSHLKKRQDYGHQAVSVMLSCDGITLNYATMMYDKSKSKIQLVCDIAEELPIAPVVSYLLCDCWYTSGKVMDAFVQKGFYTVGALKTNRVLYPQGIHVKLSEFALHLRKTDSAVRLVTVRSRQYYVYRYEGKLNGLDSAVVLICYPKEAFLNPKCLRAFLCSDLSLTTEDILQIYTSRWDIEVYFRQCKNKLGFDKYQIRTSVGIRRFWILLSLTHFLCCTQTGCCSSFELGYAYFQKRIQMEKITFIYNCGVCHASLDDVLSLAA